MKKTGKEWTDKARQKATKELDSIIADMRAAYEQKPSKAPTQEQVAVLTALRMRDTVSKRELTEALNAVRGCPLAERVIGEIAAKNHHVLGMKQELSSDAVKMALDSMHRNGSALISRLEKPGADRQTAVNKSDWSMFRLDVDPADEADCMRIFGGVSDAPGFTAAVNAE